MAVMIANIMQRDILDLIFKSYYTAAFQKVVSVDVIGDMILWFNGNNFQKWMMILLETLNIIQNNNF